ncbi:hypothetical protein E4U43_005961 [Claviceps pusilla]|uniref:SKP1 component POZ domain-containing protein n=1 Tax=Claviceps pusilla TaxID=123648 RepID=A0A9P7N491_9HYPO|nr:hypothetical protein E4U43_005961 [Claviceps pusilla]
MASLPAPSKTVTLVSGDGFEFEVLREAALVSPIIKGMLDVRTAFPLSCSKFAIYDLLTPGAGQFAEAKDARCVFQEMR